MKIQLFQIHVTYGNVNENESKIKYWFNNFLDEDTNVVVLPEMWNNGYALDELKDKADKNLNRSLAFISQLARKYNVDIVAGSVSNIKEDNVYNTAFSVNNKGEIVNEYDKVHLVPMLKEPEFLKDGNVIPKPFELSDGTLVTQIICYDLRFPELLRYPAKNGAKIAFYVAQWPSARLNHWLALLKARAIENDMFVVATNGCGDDGNTEYAGFSTIINPNGEIVQELGSEEAVLTSDINLKLVDEQRDSIPVFKNLKPNLYK